MADESLTKFDLKVVHDKFLTSLHEEDDVHLKYYLESYEELNKFFTLMGSIFGFVSSDLKAKMDILLELLNNDDSSNFETVKKMIEYEKNNKLLTKNDYVSGSRTLLRLHRGLDFIRVFLQRVSELKDKENTSVVCREVYEQTLARYHTFLVKTGARLAMSYAMPNKDELLKQVCGENPEDIQQALQVLPGMLEVTSVVYERVEKLYTVHNLHSLP